MVPDWLVERPGLSGNAKLLWARLAGYAAQTGTAWPAQETLATRLGLKRRQIQNLLAELESAGLLTVKRGRYQCSYAVHEPTPDAQDIALLNETPDAQSTALLENPDAQSLAPQMRNPLRPDAQSFAPQMRNPLRTNRQMNRSQIDQGINKSGLSSRKALSRAQNPKPERKARVITAEDQRRYEQQERERQQRRALREQFRAEAAAGDLRGQIATALWDTDNFGSQSMAARVLPHVDLALRDGVLLVADRPDSQGWNAAARFLEAERCVRSVLEALALDVRRIELNPEATA